MTSEQSDATTLGSLLRSRREDRGLTLEQAEEGTRIRRRYLEALEAEDFGALPGDVYIRGFLRLYAEYLGLDPDDVLGRYRPMRRPTQADLARPPRLDRPRDSIGGRLLVVAFIILVALGIYYVYQTQSTAQLAPPAPSPEATIAAVNPTQPPEPTPAPPTPTAEPTSIPTATATPVPDTVRVRINITGETGVDGYVNGRLVESAVLQEGDERVWEGESVRVTAADAGRVILTINSEHVGVFGADGERKDFTWLSPARAAEQDSTSPPAGSQPQPSPPAGSGQTTAPPAPGLGR